MKKTKPLPFDMPSLKGKQSDKKETAVSDAQKRMNKFRHTGEQSLTKEIIWHLNKLTSLGMRQERIFEDWLTMCKCQLKYMRRHFDRFIDKEAFTYDEDDVKFYQGLHDRYDKSWCMPHFYAATEILMMSPERGHYDILGSIFMDWGWPSRNAGQFFTPMAICRMMAKMTNAGAGVDARLKEAIKKAPLAQALMLASLVIKDPARSRAYMISTIIPACIEYYEPITVNDPCVGSGAMFIATAAETPWWHIQLGLIQFFGQDVDRVCCLMADINMKLYGLNGFWAPMIILEQSRIWNQQVSGEGETAVASGHLAAAVAGGVIVGEGVPGAGTPNEPHDIIKKVTSELPDVDLPYIQKSLFD